MDKLLPWMFLEEHNQISDVLHQTSSEALFIVAVHLFKETGEHKS